MRAIILTLIGFFVSLGIAKAADELIEIQKLVHSAKSDHKNILIQVFESQGTEIDDSAYSFSGKFIISTLYASNRTDADIIQNYNVREFPSVILLNANGNLLLPVKKVNNVTDIEQYTQMAMKVKEVKPIAQFDLEYQNKKLNKKGLYEYIVKRTLLGLDNSELIDNYAQQATKNELINNSTLKLFLEENNINIPGNFFNFITNNQEEIIYSLKCSDNHFHRLANKSMEHCFNRICSNKDENALENMINIKINSLNLENDENRDIIYNEYMTRYFHATYQPLKLANHATAYANAICKHKELLEEQAKETSKKLYSPTIINPVSQLSYALKLRNAAQYVVETISSKTMLNNALAWSNTAQQLDNDNYGIYETQAYILYKLGKKDDAITSMEKAYNLVPMQNIKQKETVGFNLIKMKRGERIY